MNSTDMSNELIRHNQKEIENRIFTIRGTQVIIDRDLADMYDVETKRLNQQVTMNIDRFPEKFRFQLTKRERNELVAYCNRLEGLRHSSSMSYAYTEQGVSILSAVLGNKTAAQIGLLIMDAFIEMREILASHGLLLQRMDRVESKQAENEQKLERIFRWMLENELKNNGTKCNLTLK